MVFLSALLLYAWSGCSYQNVRCDTTQSWQIMHDEKAGIRDSVTASDGAYLGLGNLARLGSTISRKLTGD